MITEPNVVEISAPITICSSIQGHFFDLLEIFKIAENPPNSNYLFLGNNVNNGFYSLECITLLLCLKVRYPKRIFLMRGKYDDKTISFNYGFYDECLTKYGNSKVYNYVVDVFNYFPLCAKIENQIFCVNSGLSHEINTIDEINSLERIKEIPEEGPITDLLYNEPGDNFYGFSYTKGFGCLFFGYEITRNFNETNKCKYMIIGPKLYSYKGYEWLQDNQLCSIFSSSNFCNRYRNKGAVMIIDEYLENKILQFYSPKEKYDNNKRIPDYFF